jgi:MinD-like ATPase involved in chromosome partitioning or flagellar assembly
VANVISIHSYRGGTGKSNLTANLAALIALQGKRVAVVDTDLQSPGIHSIFGFDSNAERRTLNDYLWGRCLLSEAVHDVSSALNTETDGQLLLIPGSVNADEIARILSQGYDVSLLNDGFCEVIRKYELDYLLIDTHPGLSKETFLSIAVSNALLIILRPDRQDFQGTAVTIDVAQQLEIPEMMLVLNKVLSRVNADSLRSKVTQTFNVPVAGLLPMSEDMMHLGSQDLFSLKYPDHKLTQELKQIAAQLMGADRREASASVQ